MTAATNPTLDMLPARQARELLGMDRGQFQYLIDSGQLPGATKRNGRWEVPRRDLGAYLEQEARGCRGTNRHGMPCANRPQPSGFCTSCTSSPYAASVDGQFRGFFDDMKAILDQTMYDKSYVVDGGLVDRVSQDGRSVGGAGGSGHVVDVTGSSFFTKWFDSLQYDDGDWDEERRRLAKLGSEIVSRSKQPSTIRTYTTALNGFHGWCRERGMSALPAAPQTVGAYLLWLASRGRAKPNGDLTGEHLSTAWLRTTLSAIHAEHTANGFASPTTHSAIQKLVEGYARAFGKPPTAAHAFRIADLSQLATRLLQPAPTQLRDVALLLVATDLHVRLNGSQLGRLFWAQSPVPTSQVSRLFLDEDVAAPATVDLGRAGQVRFAPADDPRICPVWALKSWAFVSGRTGPVFPGLPDDVPMSRQGIRTRVDSLIGGFGFGDVPVLDGMPRLEAEQQLQVVLSVLEVPDEQVRDVAMISLMWFGQLRRSELVAFDWGDLALSPARVLFYVGRSKTDVYGKGEPRPASAQPGYIACPVRALFAWKERYERLLGRPVRKNDPVFQALHRGGKLSGRLAPAAVNDMVQRRCDEAGVTPDPGTKISAHGGRAGGATAMLLAGKDREVVAKFSRRTASSLGAYFRPGAAFDPTQGLAAEAGESSDQLTVSVDRGEHVDGEREDAGSADQEASR